MGVVRRLQDARKRLSHHLKHASTPTPLAAAQRVALPARGREVAGVGRKNSISKALNLHSNDETDVSQRSPMEEATHAQGKLRKAPP